MGAKSQAEHWKQAIDGMIARSTATAPTEPGLYRMPCGECYVDFIIGHDGGEHWLVAGDPKRYTRETIAIDRAGRLGAGVYAQPRRVRDPARRQRSRRLS